MMCYSLDDYEQILFSDISIKLEKSVLDTIDVLTNKIDEYVKTLPPIDDNLYYSNRRRYKKQQRQGLTKQNSNNSLQNMKEWEKQELFKKTEFKRELGNNKKYEEIKILLNKLSSQNYKAIKEKLLTQLEEIIDNDNSDNEEEEDGLEKIISNMINTIKQSMGLNEVYGQIFNDMVRKYPMFINYIDGIINDYNTSYENIVYVDSNEDYNEYCNVTKKNDERRSLTGFLCELNKYNLIKNTEIPTILCSLLSSVLDNVANHEKMSYIEEVSENIFIIMNKMIGTLQKMEEWKQIDDYIRQCAKLKAKDHKGISSRIVFKYMDIVDILEKNK